MLYMCLVYPEAATRLVAASLSAAGSRLSSDIEQRPASPCFSLSLRHFYK